MSASVLLFYSNRCPHSKQFLDDCAAHGIDALHRICIDNTPRDRVPVVVKSVPALVFAGSNQCLQNEQAFQWLKQQIHQRQQQKQQQQQRHFAQSASVGGGGGGGGGASVNGGEPEAWQSTEMGAGFSDTYSFIDNSFTEVGAGHSKPENNGGSGSTIPKNFAFLNDNTITTTHGTQNQAQATVGGGGGGGGGGATPMRSPPSQPHQQSIPTNMRGMAYGGGSGHQQYQHQHQHQHQPNITPQTMQHQRGGAPSGYGMMPPTASSMAPPSNRPETDELSKRMESFRMSREQDIPQPVQRIS